MECNTEPQGTSKKPHEMRRMFYEMWREHKKQKQALGETLSITMDEYIDELWRVSKYEQ